MPKILIASDHGGYALKEALKKAFEGKAVSGTPLEWVDLGCHSCDSVDYPDYADKMAAALKDGQAKMGVLICGSGIGISIAANRHRHVRAALCHDVTTARLSRMHNNANVLALGGRVIGESVAVECLAAFLETEYEGGRHDRRIDKMS